MEDFLFGGSLRPGPPPDAGPPPDGRRPSRYGTFMMQAGEPLRYWAVVHLSPPPNWPDRGEPLALVIVTRSMTGGGLFFDVRPWLVGIFGAMTLSAFLWLPFVRGITRTIRQHVHATEQIAKGRFDVRVPEDRGDELGRLAHAVNQMAVQIDGLVRGQKRFLGDIAHELCSPIARMEMSLGILEQHISEKEGKRLEDVRDELRQISLLVNELLSFSKAALGHDAKPLETVALEPLIREVMIMEGVESEQVSITLPAGLQVKARPDLLRRAIGNVLRNAMCHAPESIIEVSATRTNGHVRLSIIDHGQGVPAESLPRLFEPFYRVDPSRTRDTGGVGLGLSIVKSCVESCGGTVTADNQKPHGLRINIELACA
jgi:two-component system sensor histidine kinase CpxA